MSDGVLLSGSDTGTALSHHLFLSVRKELGEHTPKFSLPLSLDLLPKPRKIQMEISICVTEKEVLIQPLMATENDTQRKKTGFFPPIPFPRKFSLPPLSFTQHITYYFLSPLDGSAGRGRSSGTAANVGGFYFGARWKLICSQLYHRSWTPCSPTVIDAAPCKEMPFYHMISQFLPRSRNRIQQNPTLKPLSIFVA